jgi:murein DD-endopeptidase MepM/ murein hydrolase activator NlpD
MFWPIGSKRITQYFWWRHPALDVGAPKGTPIYAADDGIVEFVKLGRTGYGQQLMVDHGNGIRTRYAHASQIIMKPGDPVKKGDVIAYVGSTGRSTGPHLHFEIFIGPRRVNPLQYIR